MALPALKKNTEIYNPFTKKEQKPFGYEVIRDGQGYCVKEPQKGDVIIKEINRSGGGGSSSKKQTPFVPPTPTFDFNKIAEQQKATQQAQQEKNLREYERQKALEKQQKALQEQLLKKINIPPQTITLTPPLMSVSKQAEIKGAKIDKAWVLKEKVMKIKNGIPIIEYQWENTITKETQKPTEAEIKGAKIDKAWVLEGKVLDTRGGIPTIEYKWKNKITGETQKPTEAEIKEITRGTVEKIITPKWNKAPFERLTKELNDINDKYGTYGAAGYGNRIAVSFSVGAAKATKDIIYGILRPDKAITGLYDLAKQLKNNPKEVFSQIENAAKTNPYQTLGYVSAMLAAQKYSPVLKQKSVSTLQKLRSKISSKYIKQVNGKFIVREGAKETFKVKGKTRYLAERVQKPSIKRPFTSVVDFLKGRKPGQFKKFTKDPGLILKAQTVKSGAKSLSEQAKLAGREVTAVNAAADQLTSWIRTKKIIRKPIPGEANFPSKIKNLLKKFDSGKRLTTKEFAYTNKWLTKNVAPNITLLERSLYLDPSAGLRISRLGIQTPRTATLRDILRGNFKLWDSSKPQVLIFENAKIAKFPKSLTTIKNKLLSGKKLTIAETNKLIRWQVQTGSGKFKPIGSTIYQGGRELEITLAPGEMIKRIKNVGFTYINGKKVTFVTAEVLKPSKAILNEIKLAQAGKIVGNKLNNLNKKLSKLLGRKVFVDSPSSLRKITKDIRRLDPRTPILRLRFPGIYVSGTIAQLRRKVSNTRIKKIPLIRKNSLKRIIPVKRTKPTKKIIPVKRTKPTKKIIPVKRTKPTKKIIPVKRTKPTKKIIPVKRTKPTKKIIPVKRTMPRGIRRTNLIKKTPPRTPPKTPPRTPPRTIARFPSKDIKKKKSKQFGYIVYAKPVKGKKFVKVNNIPLTKNRALDLRNYIADTSLSRTAMIKQVKQSPKETKMKVPVGYSSRTSSKFRDYQIKNKKKLFLKNRRVIEKNKHILDTVGEKKGISLARRIKQLGLKKQPKRKTTPRIKTARRTPVITRKITTKRKTTPRIKTARRTPVITRKITTKRKITTAQRKILLERLKKARAVRMRNLKRK